MNIDTCIPFLSDLLKAEDYCPYGPHTELQDRIFVSCVGQSLEPCANKSLYHQVRCVNSNVLSKNPFYYLYIEYWCMLISAEILDDFVAEDVPYRYRFGFRIYMYLAAMIAAPGMITGVILFNIALEVLSIKKRPMRIKILFYCATFILARNSSMADIELNPGPNSILREFIDNTKYIDLEKSLILTLFLRSGQKLDSHITEERHTFLNSDSELEFRTEFLVGNHTPGSIISSGRTHTQRLDFASERFFKKHTMSKILLSLVPISNGGCKVQIRRFLKDESIDEVKYCRWPMNFSVAHSVKGSSFEFVPMYLHSNFGSQAELQMGTFLSTARNLGESSKKVGALADKISSFAETDFTGGVREWLNSLSITFKEGIRTTLLGVAIGSAIHYSYSDDNNSYRLALFSATILTVLEGPALFSSIVEHCTITKEDLDNTNLQSGMFQFDSSMWDVVCSYFNFSKADFFKIYSAVSNIDRFTSGFNTVITAVFEVINTICEKVTSCRPISDKFYIGATTKSTILDFSASIDDFHRELQLGTMPMDSTAYFKVCEYKKMADKMLADKPSAGIAAILNRHLRLLSELERTLITTLPGIAEMRPEPGCLLFVGAPGTTKSTWAQVIAMAILDTEDVLKAKSQVYHRNFDQKHWDGYTNQTICMYDDLGKVRDIAGGGPTEYGEIMQMINNTPMGVTKASIEEKGNTYFNSEYVIATTNHRKFDIQSMTDRFAVVRRFSANTYKVIPRDDLAIDSSIETFKRKPDWNKFPHDATGAAVIRADQFYFVPYDIVSETDGAEKLTIYDVVANLKAQRRKNIAIHDYNLQNISSISKSIINSDLDGSQCSDESVDDDDCINILSGGSENQIGVMEIEYENLGLKLTESVKEFLAKVYEDTKVKLDPALFVKAFPAFAGKEAMKRVYMKMTLREDILLAAKTPFKRFEYRGKEKIASVKEQVLELFKEDSNHSRALAFIGIGATALSVVMFIRNFWQSGAVLQGNYNQPVKSTKPWKPLSQMVSAPSQGIDVYDTNGKTMLLSIIEKNSYLLHSNNKVIGQITFICGYYALMPSHFLKIFLARCGDDPESDASDELVYLRRCVDKHSDSRDWAVSMRELFVGMCPVDEMDGRDQVIVKMPTRFNAHKDIRHLFKDRSSFKEKYDCVRRFRPFVNPRDSTKISMEISEASATFMPDFTLKWNNFGSKCGVYRTQMVNANGFCGSLIVEVNSSLQKGKIIGLHSAGEGAMSFSSPVFRDDLIDLDDVVVDPIMERSAKLQAVDPFGGKFLRLESVKPLAGSGKSTLTRSRLFEKITECDRLPSKLHEFVKDGVRIDPVINSLARYNTVQNQVISLQDYEVLVASEIDFYGHSANCYVQPSILTFEESIAGLEYAELGSVSRKSSCGYPYILNRKKPGKQDFFGSGQDFEFTSPQCRALVLEIEEDIRGMVEDNIIPEMYFVDCLKDELISKEKCAIGKTRTISAGSIKMLSMFRMYFGAFMLWYTKNRIYNGSAVGVNPYGEEWDEIAKNLHSKSKYMNAGDFSGFDTKQSAQMLEAVLDIIESFYTNSTSNERKIRFLLWRRIVNSIHVVKGVINIWDCGLPSGNPLTALINTMINRIYHKLAFKRAVGYGVSSFYIFNREVYLVALGDDCVFSVNDSYAPKFNEYVLGPIFAEFGMVYTPEDKETVRTDIKRTIDEVSFLKRSWRYDSMLNRYVGPMKLKAVLSQLNWTRVRDSDEILIDKAHHVVRELSLHGKEVYLKWVPLINNELWLNYGVKLQCTNFYVTFEEVLNLACDFVSFDDIKPTMFIKPNESCDNDYPFSVCEDNVSKVSIPLAAQVQAGDEGADIVIQNDGVVDEVTPVQSVSAINWTSSFQTDTSSSIMRYLSKPVKIESGEFVAADTVSSFTLHNWDAPLTKSIYADKLKGIYTINATLVVTLQCNANQFQQGLYCVSWLPSGGLSDSGAIIRYNRTHRFSVVQRLQLATARLNLSCDTSVTLKIPFVSAYNSYLYESVRTGYTSPGTFFIWPYEPLASASGSVEAGFTLWGHYEDIKLGMAGSLQAGDLISDEQINWLKETKIVSRTLSAVSGVADSLAPIPLLNMFAGPLAWATRAASMTADSLGFSKPNHIAEPVRSTRNNFPYMGASDGVDTAEPLSMTISNHVSQDPKLLGSNIDEMSIAYIASKPSYLASIDWTLTDGVGTLLGTFSVAPTISKFSQVDNTVALTSYGPLTFLSKMFNLWRGSLAFKISLVKTAAHSGRLLVAYQLYDDILTDAIIASSLDNTDYMHRNIIDIREKNEVTILVPFNNAAEWMETRGDLGAVGAFRIYVLDKLKAPAIVSNTIQLKVELLGGPDLAFASPRNIEFNPVFTATVQAGDEDSPDMCQFDLTTIGEAVVPRRTLNAEMATQGETIPSLRMLAKRGGMIQTGTTLSDTDTAALLCPFANCWYRSFGGVAIGTPAVISRDYYSIFSSIYANARGGVRIRAFADTINASGSTFMVTLDHVNSNASASAAVLTPEVLNDTDFIKGTGNQGTVVYSGATPTSAVFVPQNSRTFSRITAANTISDITMSYSRLEADPAQVRYKGINVTPLEGTLYFHRALADDGTFGNFVSIPPHYTEV